MMSKKEVNSLAVLFVLHQQRMMNIAKYTETLPKDPTKCVRKLLPIMDEELRTYERHTACRPGCFACCGYTVVCSVPEVLLVATEIRRHRTAKERAMLLATLEAMAERERQGLRTEGGPHLCPLLDTKGRCSVYAARPFPCRGFNSTNATVCGDPKQDRPYVGEITTTAFFLSIAVRRHVPHALDVSVELCAALVIALRRDDAEARFMRGEDVFAEAYVNTQPYEKYASTLHDRTEGAEEP